MKGFFFLKQRKCIKIISFHQVLYRNFNQCNFLCKLLKETQIILVVAIEKVKQIILHAWILLDYRSSNTMHYGKKKLSEMEYFPIRKYCRNDNDSAIFNIFIINIYSYLTIFLKQRMYDFNIEYLLDSSDNSNFSIPIECNSLHLRSTN